MELKQNGGALYMKGGSIAALEKLAVLQWHQSKNTVAEVMAKLQWNDGCGIQTK